MLYLLILLLAAALWILVEFLIAPSGYEDENGFHYDKVEEPVVVKSVKEKDQNSVFVLMS
jgi:hypothetical protein